MAKYEKYPEDYEERLKYLAKIVKELSEKGVDVSSKEINKSKYSKYLDAAYAKGIPWSEILDEAGVSAARPKKYEKYPKEHYDRIIYLALKIRKLYEKGVDVSSSGIRKTKYAKYFDAAKDKEITWTEVLVAANVTLDEVMGRESILIKNKKKTRTKNKEAKKKKKQSKREKKKKKIVKSAEDTKSAMFCPKDGTLYNNIEKVKGELFKYCPKCDKWYHIER